MAEVGKMTRLDLGDYFVLELHIFTIALQSRDKTSRISLYAADNGVRSVQNRRQGVWNMGLGGIWLDNAGPRLSGSGLHFCGLSVFQFQALCTWDGLLFDCAGRNKKKKRKKRGVG